MLTPTGVTIANYNTAVKNDEPTHIRITFVGQNVVLEDADIDSSGIQIHDYLNGDTDLVFGKAVMKDITIPIINSGKLANLIWSNECMVEIGQEVSGVTKWVTYGYFSGSRPDKVNSVDVINYVAYDRMNKFDKLADPWIATLTFPMNVGNMYHNLCTYCGVSYMAGDELPNMLFRSFAESPFLYEGMSCRDVLAWIAEACGCYAKIAANGKCRLTWFSNQTSKYTVAENDEFPPVEMFDYFPRKTWRSLETYKWKDLESFRWADLAGTASLFEINSLNIVNNVYRTSVTVPGSREGNIYTIVDNPFLTFSTNTDKTNYFMPIYNRLVAFGGYIPMRVSCLGNALVEAGDIINIVVNGNTLAVPIFCKTMIWNGALSDGYETTGQLNRAEVNPTNMAKLSEGGKYKLVMQQISLVAQNKYDKQSNIQILPEGIEVSGGEYVKIISGGIFDVDATNFKIDSVNKLFNTGNWYFTEDGLKVVNDTSLEHPHYAMLSQFSQTGSVWNVSGLRIDCATYISYTNPPRYDIGSAKFKQETYLDDDMNSYNGIDFSPADSMSVSGAGAGSLGHAKKWAEINGHEIWGNDFIVTGSKQRIRPVNDNSGYVGTSDKAFYEAHINNIYGYLYNPSSRDVKHDIKDIEDKGSIIDKLNPVSFSYNNDQKNKKHYGLIYEDTLEVMPEITTQDDDNKAINYMELIPVLLKETQELRKRVAELENRVAELERG